jgi:hypothetical protein
MDFYFRSIIFEFKSNSSYVKVIISNNKVECDNKKIFKDISDKIKNNINYNNGKNIGYVEFFTSLYDYELKDLDEYWETIKNLDLSNLPIYRKDQNLEEYLLWLKENFNNNKIRIYETSRFTKRQSVFNPDEKEKCLKSVVWEQTNKKFPSFDQIFYHAGDYDDIERFGFLYVRSIYQKPKSIRLTNANVFESTELELWNKYDCDFESIKNTMFYLFFKMKKGVMVGIKNNKLAIFLPFSNNEYQNDYYTSLYFDEQDKKNLEEYKRNPTEHLKKKLENTLRYYLNKYKQNSKNVLWDRTKWVANDCFFRNENFEGDKSEATYEDFFVNLCANRDLPDCIFFLNLRDHPMLHRSLKDSYTNLVDKDLDPKYKFEKYAPILSPGGSKETADICMCTQDDWLRISKKIYPDDCANGYLNMIEPVVWDKKINKAVFRGSATGCGMEEDNVRIKAANLSLKYPEYLNAGITTFNRKLKKNLNKPLRVIDVKLPKASFMTLQEKTTYKYILNLDGHVSAFRLGHEFSLGSVLLIPKSKYYLWFSHLLEPYTHFVPINDNLDNLIEQIKWCIDNDSKCKTIASNGVEFYKKYLEKDGVYDYMQFVLNKIALRTLNLPKYKERVAVITIYRNKPDNTRLQQKRLFLYWMNKILSQICDYDIIVVEQSPKYLFNIGKLKNIGYDYLKKKSKKKYCNYIFADIDSIPDSELIEYFFKQTNSLNSLAMYGTRYESIDAKIARPFVGALISCTSEVFEELNGYPNNFYGWEGEDVNLLLRLYGIKKPLYTNSNGKIIDIEEVEGFKKDVVVKLNELNTNKSKEKESMVYEKNINWENFRSNGLTNLNYNLLYELETNYLSDTNSNFHIIVDLEQEEAKKKYPQDYEYTQSFDKDYYKNFINKKIYTIKQIKF